MLLYFAAIVYGLSLFVSSLGSPMLRNVSNSLPLPISIDNEGVRLYLYIFVEFLMGICLGCTTYMVAESIPNMSFQHVCSLFEIVR